MRAFTLKLSAIFLMVISSAFCFDNSLAHKASMGREQIEEANSMLMQLSADMKTSGTYTIEGKNLNIKDATNKETVTFTLLEDGQKIQATEDGITIVFKRLK